MRAFFRLIDGVNNGLGQVICYFVVFAMLIISFETMMRYAFNAPTKWAHEVTGLVIAAYYLLGGAYALRHAAHVNVDILHSRFPLRIRAVVDLITALLFFLFLGVVFWKGGAFAWQSLMVLETTGSPLFAPLYPVKLVLPIAASLMLLHGIATFIRNAVTAITGRPYES